MSESNLQENNAFVRLLLRSTNMQPNEVKAAVMSFLFVFLLMTAYYLVRPMRDAMASDWSDAEVSTLWTINFFISTAAVALYGFFISKVDFKKIVPSVYLFFSVSFVIFYLMTRSASDTVLVDKSFYVWISVFALFHISVFWSFMSDTYNKDQASRLFSVITAGASIGAIAGPGLSAIFSQTISEAAMVLVSAVILLFTIPIISSLRTLKVTDLDNSSLAVDLEKVKIGGNPFHGFKEFISNPYLLGIGLFIILYTGVGSFTYLEQKNLLEPFAREDRNFIYSIRDVVANTITFVLAFFLTGRIVPKLGMPVALALVPVLLILGMLILALSPIWIVAVSVWVARSAGNYGLARPAREMLFTQVDQESRYKTKPVIDIVAYRGGDVIMGWFFTGLTQGLGLGLAAVAVVGAGIAALWAVVGVFLGRIYERSEKEQKLVS